MSSITKPKKDTGVNDLLERINNKLKSKHILSYFIVDFRLFSK